MTTADIMFAQPGTGESFRDHDYNARTVMWALLAAILIHLTAALFLAAFSGVFSPAAPVQDQPPELSFVDLSPASASKNSAFIETDESKKSLEPPKDKTFESNANSIGASELAAAGQMPLPSQTGKDRPLMDFETNPHSLETKGSQPQQASAAQQQQNAPPAPDTAPLTAAEQFALLTQKSAADQSAAASQAQSAYRRERERTHIAGNITNHGISSVNALGTPLGRYQKIVADSIGSRWYVFVDQKRDLITIGTLRLRFDIDRSGKVKNLKITENSSNEAFANVCVQSVLEAHLPPIPPDVANTLPPAGLEVEGLGFIIFPNR
jgi:outer membrane biosynthesis protein TonB